MLMAADRSVISHVRFHTAEAVWAAPARKQTSGLRLAQFERFPRPGRMAAVHSKGHNSDLPNRREYLAVLRLRWKTDPACRHIGQAEFGHFPLCATWPYGYAAQGDAISNLLPFCPAG